MTAFTLRIYRRRSPGETAGQFTELVSLDARNAEAAEREACRYLVKLNWETHFAGIVDDDKSFLKFWTNEDAKDPSKPIDAQRGAGKRKTGRLHRTGRKAASKGS